MPSTILAPAARVPLGGTESQVTMACDKKLRWPCSGNTVFGAPAVLVKAALASPRGERKVENKKNLTVSFDDKPQRHVYMISPEKAGAFRPYIHVPTRKPERTVNVEDFADEHRFRVKYAEARSKACAYALAKDVGSPMPDIFPAVRMGDIEYQFDGVTIRGEEDILKFERISIYQIPTPQKKQVFDSNTSKIISYGPGEGELQNTPCEETPLASGEGCSRADRAAGESAGV